MEKSPRFSIIVPVYNTEMLLEYCLDSILAQTLDDYEIIIVNDGSTDNSPSICDSYREKYPNRIRVISQENHGLLIARRVGFAAAHGEILLTVDSDDAVHKDLLCEVASAFESYSPDMVCFAFSRDADFQTISPRSPFSEDRVFDGDEIEELCYSICNTRTFNFIWAKAFKRELIHPERSYSEFEGLSCSEDLLQVLPMLDQASRVAFLYKALYYYRLNNDSITKSFSFKKYLDNQRTGAIRLEYARQWEERFSRNDLVVGSLFMSLRETCEVLVRVASIYSVEEAMSYYETISAGELYRISSKSRASRLRLAFFYQIVLFLFEKRRYRLLSLLSKTGLKLKRFVIKQV